ncbi:tryptophan-rich sensory protein [Argonema galeatum]|uniref:tryptophan-rich sensory protein n=1 Tax=Argonema galeatum TaxID=2942762 RepID=UPI0020111690|nr:tryptophan-rich sensory protein [Argonema galeatum]MCL1468557.1 tryptophan-rich sensory protein [Argonema galeatum A003/A1]
MNSNSGRFDSKILKQWVNLIAILAAFSLNILANIAPLNELTIGEISNTFFGEVKIIPANYAFAIWGLIYLGLISLGVYQVLPAQRENPSLHKIGYLLAVASFAQIIWIFLFQYRLFALSLLAMVMILLPLIAIYLRLGIGLERVSRKELWFVHIPLSIYLGWISVATIVNVAIALYSINWNGWGISPQVWTAIMLIAAAGIAATITAKRADIAYPLVIIWAFVAIAVRQANQLALAATAGGLAIALGLLVLIRLLRRA